MVLRIFRPRTFGPGNRTQPILNRDCSHLIDCCFPPARKNPAIKYRFTTIPGRVRSALFAFVNLLVLLLESILKTSELSGKRAEPQFFAKCEFTGALALTEELETSQVSGKQYRKDRQQRSIVSGKIGDRDEFVQCAETEQPLLAEESEKCDVTGKIVVPGVLVKCERCLGTKHLPSLVERSAVTGILNWRLTLVITPLLSVFYVLQRRYTTKLKDAADSVQNQSGKISASGAGTVPFSSIALIRRESVNPSEF